MSLVADLLTYDEAAWALRIGRTKLFELIRDGHLHPVRLKGQRRQYIERRELEAYAATRR